MQSKSEPPLSNLIKLGWTTEFQHHSLCKSFHFSSQEPLKDFCLSLLTSRHSRSTNLAAFENLETCDIKVEIYSKGSGKETIELIQSIESSYKKTSNNGKQSDSIWPW